MELSRHLNYLIWFLFSCKSCCANTLLNQEELAPVLCNEAVLNTIVADLKELHKKFDLLESRLTNTNQNSETINTKPLVPNAVKETETEAILKTLSETMKDIQQTQLESFSSIEKSLSYLNRTLQDEISKQSKAQQVLNDNKKASNAFEPQTEQSLTDKRAQLISLPNANQTIIPNIEQLEGSVPNIDGNFQSAQWNTTNPSSDIECQNSENTIDSCNRTLYSIVNALSPSFATCSRILQKTRNSGVYNLNMPYTGLPPFDTYCLKDPDGGLGWTVIQRRQDGSVSFYRNWHDYKHGFGEPSGEYWLGLEKIYAMTSKQKYELWIELGDHEGERRQAKYSAFEIGNEAEKYYLKTLGEYTGNAENCMPVAGRSLKFTTFDEDNDESTTSNCVVEYLGAWWLDYCMYSSLNGAYNNTEVGRGINWHKWHGLRYSLKYTHMAIRPVE